MFSKGQESALAAIQNAFISASESTRSRACSGSGPRRPMIGFCSIAPRSNDQVKRGRKAAKRRRAADLDRASVRSTSAAIWERVMVEMGCEPKKG